MGIHGACNIHVRICQAAEGLLPCALKLKLKLKHKLKLKLTKISGALDGGGGGGGVPHVTC